MRQIFVSDECKKRNHKKCRAGLCDCYCHVKPKPELHLYVCKKCGKNTHTIDVMKHEKKLCSKCCSTGYKSLKVKSKKCSLGGCNRLYYGRGMCTMHYNRDLKKRKKEMKRT